MSITEEKGEMVEVHVCMNVKDEDYTGKISEISFGLWISGKLNRPLVFTHKSGIMFLNHKRILWIKPLET